jgi:hypothetical protein
MPEGLIPTETKHEVIHKIEFGTMGILFSALATIIVIGVRAKFFS